MLHGFISNGTTTWLTNHGLADFTHGSTTLYKDSKGHGKAFFVYNINDKKLAVVGFFIFLHSLKVVGLIYIHSK